MTDRKCVTRAGEKICWVRELICTTRVGEKLCSSGENWNPISNAYKNGSDEDRHTVLQKQNMGPSTPPSEARIYHSNEVNRDRYRNRDNKFDRVLEGKGYVDEDMKGTRANFLDRL